ncbi:hypothetical protein GF325_01950, partial [Candidatus Bathyarchaeota archaeon]|nr:hypothetical protein [Candidatus Bathyarchaeota archaeon]
MEFTLKGLKSSKSWRSWMVICFFLLVISPVPASMHDEGNEPNPVGDVQGDGWLPRTIQPISKQANTYIQNGFFQVGGDGNGITSIKIDPAGSGIFISSKDIIAGRLTLYLLEHVPQDPVGIYYYGVASTPMSMGASSVQWNLTFPGSTGSGSGSACTASLNVSIAGSSLSASMKMDFTVEHVDVYMAGITLQLPFTRSGYDTSISTTCFSRFYTSNFDLVPIEQFKRRSHLEGPSLKRWYDWMVATGVDGLDYDLNFTNFDLRTEFHIQDQMLGLCFPGPSVIDLGAAKHYSRDMVATVQSTVPGVPGQYPSFHTSNASLDALLNAMLLERSFSWSPDTGQADWLEWQNTIVDWMDSPYLEKMKNQLLGIQLEDDGYVYTWGDKIGWPFPFKDEDDDGLNDYNTRHYTTNPNFILGCWRYYSWTKDQSFLNAVYPCMYNATEYMRDNMTQWDSLFAITAPLHDGFGLRYEKGHPDYNRFDWQSCGSNYWDILPFGYKSAYCNAYIQGALRAMADIERYLGNTSRAASLEVLADKQRQTYNDIFWNEQRGRFIGCIDANGTEHDHGFTFLNMEAIYYGMANHSQAMRIYDWMENEPTATGRKDTYSKFQFAPRATTDLNEYWWHGDMDEFGGQVQDGGAILYTSGYDMRARAIYLGSDN